MHELSLAYELVGQLCDVMKREDASKIVEISLELGAMSGVEREPFEFAFPIAAEGTAAEGARLLFDQVPVEVSCDDCGRNSHPEYPVIICAVCGSNAVTVLKGKDFKVKSMEVN